MADCNQWEWATISTAERLNFDTELVISGNPAYETIRISPHFVGGKLQKFETLETCHLSHKKICKLLLLFTSHTSLTHLFIMTCSSNSNCISSLSYLPRLSAPASSLQTFSILQQATIATADADTRRENIMLIITSALALFDEFDLDDDSETMSLQATK